MGPHALPQADWPVMSLRKQGWRWRRADLKTRAKKSTTIGHGHGKVGSLHGGVELDVRRSVNCSCCSLSAQWGTCMCTHTHTDRFPGVVSGMQYNEDNVV